MTSTGRCGWKRLAAFPPSYRLRRPDCLEQAGQTSVGHRDPLSQTAFPLPQRRGIFDRKRAACHLERHRVISLAVFVVLGHFFERAHAVGIARRGQFRKRGQRRRNPSQALPSPRFPTGCGTAARPAAPGPPRGGTGAAPRRAGLRAAATAPGRSGRRRGGTPSPPGARNANGTIAVRHASERMSMALW